MFYHVLPLHQVRGWRNLDRDAFRTESRRLLTRSSWSISRLLLTLAQPTKQQWSASSKGFFSCDRPEFVDPLFYLVRRGWTLSPQPDKPTPKIISMHQMARRSLCIGSVHARCASMGTRNDLLGNEERLHCWEVRTLSVDCYSAQLTSERGVFIVLFLRMVTKQTRTFSSHRGRGR